MQRPPQHTGAEEDRQRATLEYIVDMALQLAEMAEGIGAAALADGLRQTVMIWTPPPH